MHLQMIYDDTTTNSERSLHQIGEKQIPCLGGARSINSKTSLGAKIN